MFAQLKARHTPLMRFPVLYSEGSGNDQGITDLRGMVRNLLMCLQRPPGRGASTPRWGNWQSVLEGSSLSVAYEIVMLKKKSEIKYVLGKESRWNTGKAREERVTCRGNCR